MTRIDPGFRVTIRARGDLFAVWSTLAGKLVLETDICFYLSISYHSKLSIAEKVGQPSVGIYSVYFSTSPHIRLESHD